MSSIGGGPYPRETSHEAARRAGQTALEQGWDDDTLNDLFAQFIEERGLMGDFADFLGQRARIENQS